MKSVSSVPLARTDPRGQRTDPRDQSQDLLPDYPTPPTPYARAREAPTVQPSDPSDPQMVTGVGGVGTSRLTVNRARPHLEDEPDYPTPPTPPTPEARRCPGCNLLLFGPCDPCPLTPLGETAWHILGHRTHQLVGNPRSWSLAPRTPELVTALPAGELVDVLPEHRCGQAIPQQAISVHADPTRWTKKALSAIWGDTAHWRNLTPKKCLRCLRWGLHGHDGDQMAFGHLVDPTPLDAYGRAVAVRQGRWIMPAVRHQKVTRLHHPWDSLPRLTRAWDVLAEHACHHPLPMSPSALHGPEAAAVDPWAPDQPCPF